MIPIQQNFHLSLLNSFKQRKEVTLSVLTRQCLCIKTIKTRTARWCSSWSRQAMYRGYSPPAVVAGLIKRKDLMQKNGRAAKIGKGL